MSRLHLHSEQHSMHHVGWLRAAVLGANDGIVSTASLILGVAAATGGLKEIIIAGVAGIVAGSMSMAAGEYVSVSSQSDTEKSDLERERRELVETPEAELEELTNIYVSRGLTRELAREVAVQMTAHDALKAHARDELGITEFSEARPVQAAFTSALTFATGAALPLLTAILAPDQYRILLVAIASLLFLGLLGAVGAKIGGANIIKATARVMFWGALAMILTAGVGYLFGVTA